MHVDDSCPFPSIPKLASQLCMYSAAQRAIDAYIPETTPRNSSPNGFPLAAISRPTKPRTTHHHHQQQQSRCRSSRQGLRLLIYLFVCNKANYPCAPMHLQHALLPCNRLRFLSPLRQSSHTCKPCRSNVAFDMPGNWPSRFLLCLFVCLFVCLFPFLSRHECPGAAGRTLAGEQASRHLRGGPSSGQAGWLAGWLGGGRAGLQDHAKRPSAKDGFVSLESNNVLF